MKTCPLILALALTGCAALKDRVLVNTETVLGLSASQNQATGLYEGRFGYARHELALVPTNGVDVLTEFQIKNVFSFSPGPSLYQRMAVGKEAVQVAPVLFLKNPDGSMNPQAADIIRALRHDSADTDTYKR